ncbi:DeoR/GlpR family DNA-binding transcription regulator [Vibrio fluminensis]|uniref:DeoR/GlpR family DNA-binding transcription regulator n=1 Tax=Vibrio fluminensis TaxID=2783614 RepID=UPI001E525C9B|nr:DeoR/GlpR family DNA-binding transcription regulator [Vibrio fluminensis]
MIRTTSERRESILSKLREFGSVSVIQLADEYGVSKVTVRNDLDSLENKGLLIRSHGGAMQKTTTTNESMNSLKGNLHVNEKKAIAKAGVDYIHNGDSLIIGAGTTTEQLVHLLEEFDNLFVITNGLNILLAIPRNDNISIVSTGGSLHQNSMSFYGSLAEESIEKYHVNKMIVGIDGLNIEAGITTHSEHEARFYKAMRKATDKCIVLADSSKLGKVSVHKIMPCSDIDVLITDKRISKEYREYLESLNIELVIA